MQTLGLYQCTFLDYMFTFELMYLQCFRILFGKLLFIVLMVLVFFVDRFNGEALN